MDYEGGVGQEEWNLKTHHKNVLSEESYAKAKDLLLEKFSKVMQETVENFPLFQELQKDPEAGRLLFNMRYGDAPAMRYDFNGTMEIDSIAALIGDPNHVTFQVNVKDNVESFIFAWFMSQYSTEWRTRIALNRVTDFRWAYQFSLLAPTS